MKLVAFSRTIRADLPTTPIYVNPDHVIAVTSRLNENAKYQTYLWMLGEEPEIGVDEDIGTVLRCLSGEQSKIDELRRVLRLHHDWHLGFGEVSAPDGKGGYVTWDLSDAYTEGTLCDKTVAALAGKGKPEKSDG